MRSSASGQRAFTSWATSTSCRPTISGKVGTQPEDLDPDALLDAALDALALAVRQRASATHAPLPVLAVRSPRGTARSAG